MTDTIERINDSAVSGSRHYMLFVGPRGSGKSHLVSLIFYRLEQQLDLRQNLRIAWLAEDKTFTSVLNLNRRVYEALSYRYPDEFPSSHLNDIYGQSPADAITYLNELLGRCMAEKSGLIILENLDVLFETLGRHGQHIWRSFLQESGKFSVLTTAQQLFPGVSDRNLPFYGTFQVSHLEPLTVAEGQKLLKNIAAQQEEYELVDFLNTPDGHNYTQVLHHLSDGNHRIFVTFSKFMTQQSLDALSVPLKHTLEDLVPYYQERLRWLAPQQRMLIEHLCDCDRAISVKELAKRLFSSSQTVSKQLSELKKKRYVVSSKQGRESLYELSEPFMRLAMVLKSNSGSTVDLLIRFLHAWYRCEGLHFGSLSLTHPSLKPHETVQLSICDNARIGPEDLRARIAQVGTMMVSGHWEKGWKSVASCLLAWPPQKIATNVQQYLICIVLQSARDETVWSDRLMHLREIYASVGALTYLGVGAVSTLPLLEHEGLSINAMDRWKTAWHNAVGQSEELRFALRLFDAGIAYMQSGEKSVFWTLPIEQRVILEQLFDIGGSGDRHVSSWALG